MFLIDPHAHTTYSDGTDTPLGLILAAEQAGLDVVGITDHDTTAGWEEAEIAARDRGMGLVRGAEISASYRGYPVHVLGLLFDGENEGVQGLFRTARESRSTRLAKMVENLTSDYPLISWDSVVARAAGAPLGRPHLADELVEKGYFPGRNEAFEWALHPHGPYYFRQFSVTPGQAVSLINEAGGVAIFAHPRSTKRGRSIPIGAFDEMADAGVYALELHHRDHSSAAKEEIRGLAKRYGLQVTGGSDYHGTGKPNRLGENFTDRRTLEDIQDRTTLPLILPSK